MPGGVTIGVCRIISKVSCVWPHGVGHNRCKGGTHTARCQLINQSINQHTETIRNIWISYVDVKIGIIFHIFALKVSHLQTPAIHSLYTLHRFPPMLKCLRTYFSLWTNWTNKSVEDQGCQFPSTTVLGI